MAKFQREGYCPVCFNKLRFIEKMLGHKCPGPTILVDREGVAYPPRREVQLKGKKL